VDKRYTPEAAAETKQQLFSLLLDKVGHEQRLAEAALVDKATLLSECEPGARAFWNVQPSKALRLNVASQDFCVEVQSRLCMQDGERDRWCPLCDQVYDTRGHHAKMCSAGGDRTLCHNALRNFVHRFLLAAGLHPELERPGLLLPMRPDDVDQTARRPADVYLPNWTSGQPAALDFAVTAPQRQATLQEAAVRSLASASDYVEKKRSHLNTASLCEASGVTFLPMVVESSGAWAPSSAKVLFELACAVAARTGRESKVVHKELLEGCAVAVRRSKAKAVLKRAVDGEELTAFDAAIHLGC